MLFILSHRSTKYNDDNEVFQRASYIDKIGKIAPALGYSHSANTASISTICHLIANVYNMEPIFMQYYRLMNIVLVDKVNISVIVDFSTNIYNDISTYNQYSYFIESIYGSQEA